MEKGRNSGKSLSWNTYMDERTAIAALSRLPGINRFRKRGLLEAAGSGIELFRNPSAVQDPGARHIIGSFDGWKGVEKELEVLTRSGGTVLTINDTAYPVLLKNTPDPPLVLYRKGTLGVSRDTIAIVGSRRATVAGLSLAGKIAETLSGLGITVISGFARGVDTASHRGALKGTGGTVAVLGCGIDICYPAENKGLFEQIGADGLIVTEYGLGEKPLGYHFPERNRIIAGLSKAVLVIEATERSGSLITARLGLEYGRDVMSVPGSIFDEEYRGANVLIKEGAKLIAGIEDILSHSFPLVRPVKEKQIDMEPEEGYIYSLIGPKKVHVDEVVERSGLETKKVMALLTTLEMKDAIRAFPGGFYVRG
jgi:DNA processing protein